ncbi:MAG: diguanylate cyclase [Deltaproteobacteria bacterium]|nr:diguanylate cyclase [Deltaproteobacteria bacterium]
MFDADDLLDDTPRRKFEQTLAKRCREGDSFALMLVELERFSEVSKSSGRQAGDLLLYEIASRLRDKLGERDMAMRSGSNEFVVLALGVEQVGDAERLAEQLVERLEHPFPTERKHRDHAVPTTRRRVAFATPTRQRGSLRRESPRQRPHQHHVRCPEMKRLRIVRGRRIKPSKKRDSPLFRRLSR